MSVVVIDTDVVSFLFKSHPAAMDYLAHLVDRTPVISFMTVAGLNRWVLEARWRDALRKRWRDYLEPFVIFRTIESCVRSGQR